MIMAINQVRPTIMPNIIGCHVKEGQARFDFNIDEKFQPEQLKAIEALCNQLVAENHAISLYASQTHADARFWQCKDDIIPCGGTHLDCTGTIGPLSVKRKGLGKQCERIICTLNQPVYRTDHYHHPQ